MLCGIARLARFNVTVSYLPKDKTGKSKYFEGFPMPVSKDYVFDKIPLGIVREGKYFEFHPLILLFFVHGCGMISKSLKIPKL